MKCKQRRLKVKIILLLAMCCCSAFFAQDSALAAFKSKPNTGSSLSLRIKLNDTDITEKTHTVWAGRRLSLTVSSQAGDVSNVSWSVPSDGIPLNGWYPTTNEAHIVLLNTTDQATLNVAFFQTGGPFTVNVHATVQGKTGSIYVMSTYVKFNISKPQVTVTYNTGSLWAKILGQQNTWKTWTGLDISGKSNGDGNWDIPNVGVDITASFPNGTYSGTVEWIQLIVLDQSPYKNYAHVLDTTYPYNPQNPHGLEQTDSPLSWAIPYSSFTREFHAYMYLMWHCYSQNGTVFWVPLKKIDWGFHMKADDGPGGSWLKNGTSYKYTVSVSGGSQLAYPPVWNDVWK